jgi:hypothetical protein
MATSVFMRIAKFRRFGPLELRLVDLIREHNRLDVELYEFGKKLFAESLGKREDGVREGLATLRAIPRPEGWRIFANRV